MNTVDVQPKRTGWRRPVFLAVSAAVVLAILIVGHSILLPFVMAVVIAYVLAPFVGWVEKRRVPRPLAIIIVYAVVLGSIALFIQVTAPRLVQELNGLRREVPNMITRVQKEWIPAWTEKLRVAGIIPPAEPEPKEELPQPNIVARPQTDGAIAVDLGSGIQVTRTHEGYLIEGQRDRNDGPFDPNRLLAESVGKTFSYAQHNALEIARIGRDIIAGISRAIFLFFITLMLAAYVMMTRERIRYFFRHLVRPSARPAFDKLLDRVDRGCAGVVRGQLLICLINGVLSAIGFAIVGLKYWPVLSVIAAVLSLIPIFGSIVSTIPAVAIGLTQGFGTAVFVLVWIIGIHQIEANLLNPKIMGDAAKIHPVLVVFSLLFGEHFFGAVGALLAVPCMAIAKAFFLHFREIAQQSDPELVHEPVTSIPPTQF